MSQGPRKPVPQLVSILLLAGVSLAAWAAWLGWDQHRDVHPDGTTTGPYEAWQVIGLVLILLAPVYWAASRRYLAGAVLGTTAGLTVAAYYDWSDDSSGLFMVGVGLVMIGSLAVTAVVSAIASATRQGGRPRGH
uniref:Integral membrane protein n=1 Tax=Streptomyces sp. NBC_01393 TaxID=2903851 RepID=A0AAU3I3I0_9ACTN